MRYFSLAHRVPEATAVEPKILTWVYGAISAAPLARTVHQRVVSAVLQQGIAQGYGLDLGSGPGVVTMELAENLPGLRMTGLDLAAHMVTKARRNAIQMGFNGNVLWPQADGHRLPFADKAFDLVVSSFALHHWRDPLCVLNEIARVLRPHGQYYISDVSRETTLLQRMVAYASIPAISLPFGSYWGYGGYYESVRAGYTQREAKDLLEQSNLPPGAVKLDSTWFVPVVVLASGPSGRSLGAGHAASTRSMSVRHSQVEGEADESAAV